MNATNKQHNKEGKIMNNNGYIVIPDNFIYSNVWKRTFVETKVIAITLLLLAEDEKKNCIWKEEDFLLLPGELIESVEFIRTKCGKEITMSMLQEAFEELEALKFIRMDTDGSLVKITILNWEIFTEEYYIKRGISSVC